MSHVEVCLTRLIDCTGDNEITIEAVLDVANYICHTKQLGENKEHEQFLKSSYNLNEIKVK